MKWFRVRNWRKFQRYRDRTPPWIKVYTWLINYEDGRNWLNLTSVQRGQLVSIWLLASQRGNVLPFDPELIAGDIGVEEAVDLEALVRGKWIRVYDSRAECVVDAQKDAQEFAQVSAQKSAHPETERETEREAGADSLKIPPESSARRSAEQPAGPPPVLSFILVDKSEYGVEQDQVDRWAEQFPAVDVPQQLRAMQAWLEANPTKRKTRRGITRFIVNWLSKEQDRGGSQRGPTVKAWKPRGER